MSVVVPPMSMTMASGRSERNAAPRMLLVGPEEKVNTGYCTASSALVGRRGGTEGCQRGRDGKGR